MGVDQSLALSEPRVHIPSGEEVATPARIERGVEALDPGKTLHEHVVRLRSRVARHLASPCGCDIPIESTTVPLVGSGSVTCLPSAENSTKYTPTIPA